MGKRGDVGRANGIVARGERGGTQVARRVDWSDLPPHIVRLGCATLVTLKFIFYQYLRFVRIVSIAPPARHRAIPLGFTTMPFCEGLYLPRMMGLSLAIVIRLSVAPFKVGIDIILPIPILVQHVGQLVGVWHEGFGHDAMHLERAALQPHTAVALAVVRRHQVPRGRVALGLGSREYVAIFRHVVEGAALLPEMLIH